MLTRCIFICGLHNIEVKEDLADGLILIPHKKNSELPTIRITNNKEKIKSLITEQFSNHIGTIEYYHLVNGYPVVAYAESEFEIETISSSIQHLDLHLYLLKMFFFCLWLTKDNAVDFDIGFLQFHNAKKIFEVSSNNMTNTNFDVSGTRTSHEFSIKELTGASEYLKDRIQIEYTNRPKFANASTLDRVSIALYFVQSAIAAHDLGIKAVSYCSALETLFSNGDNTELSHKLSERISKFLEAELESRKSLYKAVKKIYEIRSKVVHGASYKSQKADELANLVMQADEICRRVMTYAIITPEEESIFDKTKEDLEMYFVELILK